jgi:hypothetical protein
VTNVAFAEIFLQKGFRKSFIVGAAANFLMFPSNLRFNHNNPRGVKNLIAAEVNENFPLHDGISFVA